MKLKMNQVNITPETPTPMSGYDARKTPFTGIHDSLYASALYFTGDNTSLLLITADVIGYNRDFVDETRNLISSKTGTPQENKIITAVHNHGFMLTGREQLHDISKNRWGIHFIIFRLIKMLYNW